MSATDKIKKLKASAEKRLTQRAEMKRELASHAIETLSQLGYARTGLRDIAAQSGRSVGAISYYFEDKIDLISYCVRLYKDDFVMRIDDILSQNNSPDKLVQEFIDGFVLSLEKDAATHCLWYDIRSQAQFEEGFRSVVADIEAALIDMVGRLLGRLKVPHIRNMEAYYLLDGSFRYHLQRRIEGDPDAIASFKSDFGRILANLRQ